MRAHLFRWAFAVLTLVVIVLLALPGFSMLQPGYYKRYPVLGARMEHWAGSTHSKIACVGCHVDPGFKGAATFAIKAIPAFYSQLAYGPSDTNLLKPPHAKACQTCHTTYRRVSPGGDLLIPHRAHVEVLKMECVTCHEDLVHSLSRRGYNRPEMETCLTCHDGHKATDKCMKCHTQKHVPAGHRQKTWLKVHGQQADSKSCGGCHDWTPDYCANCHEKRPASHVGNWKTGHAALAKERGDGCLVCHGGKKFCEECH